MGSQAIGVQGQKIGGVVPAHGVNGCTGGSIDFGYVERIGGLRRIWREIVRGDAKGAWAVGQAAGVFKMLRRGLGVLVVFQHEEHGQLPQGGQVHALVDHAFAHGAVA